MGRLIFTAPQDFVSLCVFLPRLILTWRRVLDSAPLLRPAHYCRLRFHVDNCSIQHCDLHNTILLLEGVYHHGRMAYVPVAQPGAVQHPCFPQASIWLTFVRALLFPNSHRFDSASTM